MLSRNTFRRMRSVYDGLKRFRAAKDTALEPVQGKVLEAERPAASGRTSVRASIRTSEKDWLSRLTRAYREHAEVDVVDDAGIGIDPATQSLLQMGLAGRLTRKEWTAVTVSGGMTVLGASMVVLAILDPDPTSKLGLLVGSGALLALTGGFQTIRLLTRQKPPSITITAKGIHIDWQ